MDERTGAAVPQPGFRGLSTSFREAGYRVSLLCRRL